MPTVEITQKTGLVFYNVYKNVSKVEVCEISYAKYEQFDKLEVSKCCYFRMSRL